jgi:uncharacterized membrane protein YphA (DoxX/SURF4 family)
MPRTNSPGSLVILQLALGVFFILIGLEVIIKYQSFTGRIMSGIANFFGDNKHIIDNVIAIIEIVCGAILIIALFVPIGRGAFNFIILVIFALWAARIVYFEFIYKAVFQPNWIAWLQDLCLDIIVLIGIWATRSKSA